MMLMSQKKYTAAKTSGHLEKKKCLAIKLLGIWKNRNAPP
jgi:hypothetical protein